MATDASLQHEVNESDAEASLCRDLQGRASKVQHPAAFNHSHSLDNDSFPSRFDLPGNTLTSVPPAFVKGELLHRKGI